MQGPVGRDRLLAAAEDRRVAALDAERGGVDGHVGPALVDHEDHAERDADLPDVQPVGAAARRDVSPIGSGSAATSRSACAISSTRFGSSLRRSIAAAFRPRPGAAATSAALAARISSAPFDERRGRTPKPGILGRAAGHGQLPRGQLRLPGQVEAQARGDDRARLDALGAVACDSSTSTATLGLMASLPSPEWPPRP